MSTLRNQLGASLSGLAAVVGLLLQAGCDDPVKPAPEVASLRLSADSLVLVRGTVDTLSVTALDEHGTRVPGAKVTWSSSDTTLLAVDTAGVVTARNPGVARVSAAVARSTGAPVTVGATVRIRPAVSVALDADSVVLAAPLCSQDLFAHVYTLQGQEQQNLLVDYSIADSSLATLERLPITSRISGHIRRVRARRAGTTRLIASYEGAADTAQVRVVTDSVARFYIASSLASNTPLDVWEMAPGDTTRFVASANYPPCTAGQGTGYPISGVNGTFRSLDESVATVDAGGRVIAHAPGTARVVTQWGRFADTARVDVMRYRIQPADTTVFVGDTVRYRAFAIDPAGKETEIRIFGVGHLSDVVAVVSANVPSVVGQKPGTDTLTLGILNAFRQVTIRVAARP